MENIIIIGIVILIVVLAGGYLLNAKKRGQACVGCPYSKACNGKCKGK